jgi:hypothetical protein
MIGELCTWILEFLNKLQITEGLTLVYGNDNKSYWYTGLTSVGKDESAVGFVLDTRTKETIFINRRCNRICGSKFGAGKVQEKDIRLRQPVSITSRM